MTCFHVTSWRPCSVNWIHSYANIFFCFGWKTCSLITWVETLYKWLKQPRPRLQQERQKFAYLAAKNSSFARFARALRFPVVPVLSRTCNDLFYSCVGPRMQLTIFFFSSRKRSEMLIPKEFYNIFWKQSNLEESKNRNKETRLFLGGVLAVVDTVFA